MRLRRKTEVQVRRRKTQVDSIPRQHFAEVTAINYGERVKAENTGDLSFGFNVGQATGANSEFIVSVPFGNAKAGTFHLTHGEAKALA